MIGVAPYPVPFTLVRDRELGWLRRIPTTPLSPQKLLLPLLIANLLLGIISFVVTILGSFFIFGASLSINVFHFTTSILLTIIPMFSLGLPVAAIAPIRRFTQVLIGGLFHPLLFFSGL
ncbi:MAG: ABC transporter permease [Candidatus Thermoplasmatota archaeon]|nr:ABC transporter permease [Candidatus Thermoplasmatota archaeon]MCL5437784.1 ABC transporter permease [Candidatus Thermoplasmatota archaeon]